MVSGLAYPSGEEVGNLLVHIISTCRPGFGGGGGISTLCNVCIYSDRVTTYPFGSSGAAGVAGSPRAAGPLRVRGQNRRGLAEKSHIKNYRLILDITAE